MFGNNLKHWQRRQTIRQLLITAYIYCEVNILHHLSHVHESFIIHDALHYISTTNFWHGSYLQADPQYKISQQYRLVSFVRQNYTHINHSFTFITEKNKEKEYKRKKHLLNHTVTKCEIGLHVTWLLELRFTYNTKLTNPHILHEKLKG